MKRPSAEAARNASISCNACRAKKRKVFASTRDILIVTDMQFLQCGGGDPCDYCRRTGTQCIVDEESDGRKRLASKRKIAELEQNGHFLRQIIQGLRGSQDEMFQVLDLCRRNASYDEIRHFLNNSAGSVPENGQEIFRSSGDNWTVKRRILDVNWLADIPVVRVPAKPWTSVTNDDDFVSHLVSLYFTWQQCFYNVVKKDLFIQDMQSGNPDAQFCSPLLVNAILAEACVSLPFLQDFVFCEGH